MEPAPNPCYAVRPWTESGQKWVTSYKNYKKGQKEMQRFSLWFLPLLFWLMGATVSLAATGEPTSVRAPASSDTIHLAAADWVGEILQNAINPNAGAPAPPQPRYQEPRYQEPRYDNDNEYDHRRHERHRQDYDERPSHRGRDISAITIRGGKIKVPVGGGFSSHTDWRDAAPASGTVADGETSQIEVIRNDGKDGGVTIPIARHHNVVIIGGRKYTAIGSFPLGIRGVIDGATVTIAPYSHGR